MTHKNGILSYTSARTSEFANRKVFRMEITMFKETRSVSGVHRLSKNLVATLKFWAPELWQAKSSTPRTYKLLGATVRKLVARATWRSGFVHPWSVSLRVFGAVFFNLLDLSFVSTLYIWERRDMLQSCCVCPWIMTCMFDCERPHLLRNSWPSHNNSRFFV